MREPKRHYKLVLNYCRGSEAKIEIDNQIYSICTNQFSTTGLITFHKVIEEVHSMNNTERIRQAITSFVKGGDQSDVDLLSTVLHDKFRVVNNGFMGTLGVTIIDKEKYLSNIREGVFGGLPREMVIESIDEGETIAMVKLRLESSENSFVSYNSLVLDTDNKWKLINNLAVVTAKAKF